MKLVSWVVVIGSLVWLLAGTLGLRMPDLDWGAIPPREVTGTVRGELVKGGAPQHMAAGLTQAWNSGQPARVAAFYTADATLNLEQGQTFKRRAGIEAMAAALMAELPDLTLTMTSLESRDGVWVYSWKMAGTRVDNGEAVALEGQDHWRLNDRGLIRVADAQLIINAQPN